MSGQIRELQNSWLPLFRKAVGVRFSDYLLEGAGGSHGYGKHFVHPDTPGELNHLNPKTFMNQSCALLFYYDGTSAINIKAWDGNIYPSILRYVVETNPYCDIFLHYSDNEKNEVLQEAFKALLFLQESQLQQNITSSQVSQSDLQFSSFHHELINHSSNTSSLIPNVIKSQSQAQKIAMQNLVDLIRKSEIRRQNATNVPYSYSVMGIFSLSLKYVEPIYLTEFGKQNLSGSSQVGKVVRGGEIVLGTRQFIENWLNETTPNGQPENGPLVKEFDGQVCTHSFTIHDEMNVTTNSHECKCTILRKK